MRKKCCAVASPCMRLSRYFATCKHADHCESFACMVSICGAAAVYIDLLVAGAAAPHECENGNPIYIISQVAAVPLQTLQIHASMQKVMRQSREKTHKTHMYRKRCMQPALNHAAKPRNNRCEKNKHMSRPPFIFCQKNKNRKKNKQQQKNVSTYKWS